MTTNWRDQGRLLGGGGTCDEPLSTEMGLPDQGEEARLHGIRWLVWRRLWGSEWGLHVLEASLRPHADLKGVGPWAL